VLAPEVLMGDLAVGDDTLDAASDLAQAAKEMNSQPHVVD